MAETDRFTNNAGGTNYKGRLLFLGEGQGEKIAPTMYLMNPEPPYNTTGKRPMLKLKNHMPSCS